MATNGNIVEEKGLGKQPVQPPPSGGNDVLPPLPPQQHNRFPQPNPLPLPVIHRLRCISIKLRLPKAPGTAGLILRDDSASGLPILAGLHPSQRQVPRGMIEKYYIIGIRDMERGRAIETRTQESLHWWMGAFQSTRGEVEVEIVFYPLVALAGGPCKGGKNAHGESLGDAKEEPIGVGQDVVDKNDEKEEPIHGGLSVVDKNDAEGISGIEEASFDFHFDQTTKTDEVSNSAAANGKTGDEDEANASDNVSSDESLDENPHNHTQEELDRIKAIERESLELFPPGRRDIVYEHPRDLVAQYREKIAHRFGFKVERLGASVLCHRCEDPESRKRRRAKRRGNVPEDKRRVRRNVRCGCTFKFNYSYVKKLPGGSRRADDCQVFVTRASYRHSHGCSGFQPAILTKEQERRLEVEAAGRALNSRPAADRAESATAMVERFRPMFKVLAKHPRKKALLAVLEGVKNLIEGNDAVGSDAAAASGALSGDAKDEEEEQVEREGGQEESASEMR